MNGKTDESEAAGGASGEPHGPDGDPRREIQRLREELARSEAAVVALGERCEDEEEIRAHLARLCVVSARLHDSEDPEEGLRGVEDVLVNLIGAAETAIFSLSPDGRTLVLRASQGIDARSWESVAVGEGTIGRAAMGEETWTDEPGDMASVGPGQPTACLPLRVGGRVVGVIALFRLLPHRGRLSAHDREVLGVLSRQAGFVICRGGAWWGEPREVEK